MHGTRGVTVVVSAGNEGEDACDFTPAHVNELITVGATDGSDQRWYYSNYGSCVDLFAPTILAGGTSTAAALVSGASAAYLEMHPSASPSTVASALISNSTQGVLSGLGSGSPNRLLYVDSPVLGVSISGPTQVTTSGTKLWTATAVNAEGPVSYQWYRKTDYWWPRGQGTCH
jgi:hypothetical protein